MNGQALAFAAACGLILTSVSVLLSRGVVRDATLLFLSRQALRMDRELRFLRSPIRGKGVLRLQLGLLLGGAGMFLGLGAPWALAVSLGLALLPVPLLARSRKARLEACHRQVEPCLGAISRALVAAPSLGEALVSARAALDAPLGDEMDEVLEEMALGTPLQVALRHLAERVPRENVRILVLTLTLGQRSGGGLDRVLNATASSMREMERLEGVLRTKTADGKAQSVVIALLPFPVLGAIYQIDPAFFQPLLERTMGHFLIGVSLVLWVSSFFVARRILAVDL